jgi:hypothetical protein
MTGPEAYATQLKKLVKTLRKEIVLGVILVFAKNSPNGAKKASYLFRKPLFFGIEFPNLITRLCSLQYIILINFL